MAIEHVETSIESILHEDRVFPPPPEFSAKAHIKSMEQYLQMYQESIDDPEKFWAKVARQLHWFKRWKTVREWNRPFAKWFVGGKTNISYNCLDRHLSTTRKNKAAIVWEGEPGEIRTLTYQQLHREVCRFANGLLTLGVKKRGPRRHLHGDGARTAGRDAGVRAHRRDPFGRLRRLFGRGAARPHQRRAGSRSHHPGRGVPARHRDPAEEVRGRGRAVSAPRSRTSSSTGAPAPRSTSSRAEITGGTT